MSFENSGPIVQQPSSSDLSFIGGTGIAVGQLVYVSANGTVSPTTGAQNFVGIVKSLGVKSALAGNNLVTVTKGPAKVRVTVQGTVAAGDMVVSYNNGQGITNNSATTKYMICDTGASSGGTAICIL